VSARTVPLARRIEDGLAAIGTPERAEGAKRYLKSELEFFGVATPPFRRVLLAALKEASPLSRGTLLAETRALWARPVFELRAAAAELLSRKAGLLLSEDIGVVEAFLRESRTWALVDVLAPHVAGPLLVRHPEVGPAIDRWSADADFWLRRAALLTPLVELRRGGGDFERFARYADAMLDEKEFFVRKAIGWVLREVGKKRPRVVVDWLAPRIGRASGVTVREAVRHLPAADRERLLARYRSAHSRGRQ
jgi:3-methyladenine DNA glycosylase AlkD